MPTPDDYIDVWGTDTDWPVFNSPSDAIDYFNDLYIGDPGQCAHDIKELFSHDRIFWAAAGGANAGECDTFSIWDKSDEQIVKDYFGVYKQEWFRNAGSKNGWTGWDIYDEESGVHRVAANKTNVIDGSDPILEIGELIGEYTGTISYAFDDSPWGYLSGDVKIDMGYTASTGASLFVYLQTAGLMIGIVLILSAVVGYVTTQSGQTRAAYKHAAGVRILVTCMIAGSVVILSAIMGAINFLFGVSM